MAIETLQRVLRHACSSKDKKQEHGLQVVKKIMGL